ncbi:MAG: deoxyribodipyrimidine photo-lyase [Candidatus Latescibacteria bacterium]|nr:deoxyribodipyrimidine photo-lyase [bacterium]MBD3423072.1 deoxyribodipyrimidine photo-lyase [Candidatus Latescibacterota bacterium]
MSRDQRVEDNWALLHAAEISGDKSLAVLFNLVPEFEGAALRQYWFMLEGLKEVYRELRSRNIPFHITVGDPAGNISEYIRKNRCGALVTDFDPLKIKRRWKKEVAGSIDTAFIEVDAHNIVPSRKVSGKQEYAAYTIRPKIEKVLDSFLTDFPEPGKKQQIDLPPVDWDKLYDNLKVDRSVGPVEWLKPGAAAAKKSIGRFIEERIERYPGESNDPNKKAVSDISPYLHFGQISAQRIALMVREADISPDAREAYLEELIIRRELSDNYCLYNDNYDSTAGFPDWAIKTLGEHKKDKREFNYSGEEFENARTHDPLWNAAQREMVTRGKMHGYMRMYWAKKILEWTSGPEEAFEIALHLNDRYELDGRDPNGYAGIAWAVGGVHDRAWKEREIFGKIRYMNYNGCRRKFNVDEYIDRYQD